MGQENIYLIAFVGEAGAGKDTIANALCDALPELTNKVVSWTTRPKRDYETQDKDYHFASEGEFFREEKFFLEKDNFNGWYYATHSKSLAENKVNIGVYTPKGCRELLKYDGLYPIFFKVDCGSKIRLLRQLERDNDTSPTEICRRFLADKKDFDETFGFPYHTLKNETTQDLDEIVADLRLLIKMLYNFMID